MISKKELSCFSNVDYFEMLTLVLLLFLCVFHIHVECIGYDLTAFRVICM
jgi:hypothetical protein